VCRVLGAKAARRDLERLLDERAERLRDLWVAGGACCGVVEGRRQIGVDSESSSLGDKG
jgi:hypothetical protein